ncbi:MAG: enoyl-CoA hydratase/isomerase family protein [Burkholderiales bacterium]|nr:enoyl-CoA hydratase/isomerase family protein [Burkholderiales bacterium]
MKEPLVQFEIDEAIATISLNDGDRMNPLGGEMIQGLTDAVARAREDKTVRAVILTGRGRGFCVGADLARYRELIDKPDPDCPLGQYVGELMTRMNPVVRTLNELPVPVVCAVNGVAAGGGMGLALAGDLVIAAKSSYFYLPFFPALGAMPDMGVTWALPRAIGRARALGLAITGEKLPAHKAQEWGLIWACVEDDRLQAEARRMAHALAAMPQHAILEARAIFAAAESNTLAQQLDLERSRQMELVGGESFAEGVRAFSERRKPVFRGR